jgi:hypothetical protein
MDSIKQRERERESVKECVFEIERVRERTEARVRHDGGRYAEV